MGWFNKNVFRPLHKTITNNRQNIVGVLDFATNGAISRQEERSDSIREAEKQARFLEESTAKDWSQTQRQAAIAAQQANMDAEAIGEQSRAGAIDQFKAESAALADSGLSGISEGSPYMATQASLNEVDRALRTWFSRSSESIAMTGENTAMSIENARFNKKVGEENLSSLRNNINDMKEANNGLNMALDFFGGFFKNVASVYSIGSTAVAGLNMAGVDLKGLGLGSMNNGQMPGLGGMMRLGGQRMYTGLTGDSTFFNDFDPPKMDIWGSDARKFGEKAQDLWGGFKDSAGQTQLKGLALPRMPTMATPEQMWGQNMPLSPLLQASPMKVPQIDPSLNSPFDAFARYRP